MEVVLTTKGTASVEYKSATGDLYKLDQSYDGLIQINITNRSHQSVYYSNTTAGTVEVLKDTESHSPTFGEFDLVLEDSPIVDPTGKETIAYYENEED